MDAIVDSRSRLLVRQRKEWAEILVDFETRNRYELLDASGRPVGFVAEESGGAGALLGRLFLGSARACTLHVFDAARRPVGRLVKPFRFWFFRMEAHGASGEYLGAVERRFAILHRRFDVTDASGNVLLRIVSPFLRIWTFKVFAGPTEVARIAKKWGGLLREVFTDADTFGIEFTSAGLASTHRQILLAATFLVDFTCFENNQRR